MYHSLDLLVINTVINPDSGVKIEEEEEEEEEEEVNVTDSRRCNGE